MYPSDYGYAANMTSCSGINLNSYSSSCAATDWLFKSAYSQSTISPGADSSNARRVFYVASTGDLYNTNGANVVRGARPVTYLSSDIKIVDGTGTDTNPFILEK